MRASEDRVHPARDLRFDDDKFLDEEVDVVTAPECSPLVENGHSHFTLHCEPAIAQLQRQGVLALNRLGVLAPGYRTVADDRVTRATEP